MSGGSVLKIRSIPIGRPIFIKEPQDGNTVAHVFLRKVMEKLAALIRFKRFPKSRSFDITGPSQVAKINGHSDSIS